MKTAKTSTIAYYITSHGYGHGVRSCGIIKAINEMCPQLCVRIVSRLPISFLESQVDTRRNPVRAESFDIGMCQIDSIRVDVPATLEQVRSLYSSRAERVEREARYLERNCVGVVVADIPAIPIEAAALAGIPSVAVGNFSWDWIYSEFLDRDSGWQPIVEILREEYAKTGLLLRLPFSDSMSAFPNIEELPLLASPGKSRRAEIAGIVPCDPAKRWILLSFTTLEWSEEALKRVEGLGDYEFFTVDPLRWDRRNIHPLDPRRIHFSDLLASMDAVISKPGFGILSDCIACKKPLIYADRSNFLEYPILVESTRKYLRNLHIPAAALYLGDLRESLEKIWTRPEPAETLPSGGDRIAARRITQLL